MTTQFGPSYVRAIAPYIAGKPISEVAREFGLDEARIVKLASNENPLGVSPRAKAAIKKQVADLGRYPDGNAFDLRAALAKRYKVHEGCIVVGAPLTQESPRVLEIVARYDAAQCLAGW